MKVCHLHTEAGWGGGENQVLRLLQGLGRRGIETVLFARAGGSLFGRAVEAGLDARPLRSGSVPRGRGRVAAGLCRALRELDPDLLHAHDSGSVGLAGACGRKVGVPVVYTRRVASALRANPLSVRKYSPARLDAVIAISETVKGVFARSGYPAGRIHVVPSGLNLGALDAVEADAGLRRSYGGQWLVVGVGTLSVKKNWSLLIRVAGLLDARGLDVRWLLAGEGPERPALERLIGRLGLEKRVLLLGFRTDCERLLKTADLLFFPSRMEGASVTVREAMALGTPVVAVNHPGTAESLGGNGWLIADDAREAADCVERVLRDPEQRRRAAEGARQRAHGIFSMERTVEGTLAVYESLLSNPQRPIDCP